MLVLYGGNVLLHDSPEFVPLIHGGNHLETVEIDTTSQMSKRLQPSTWNFNPKKWIYSAWLRNTTLAFEHSVPWLFPPSTRCPTAVCWRGLSSPVRRCGGSYASLTPTQQEPPLSRRKQWSLRPFRKPDVGRVSTTNPSKCGHRVRPNQILDKYSLSKVGSESSVVVESDHN